MEKRKRVLDSSFGHAVKHCLVHILPVCISSLLVSLNLRGVNIGQELGTGSWHTTYTLAAFQVAAKLQASCPRILPLIDQSLKLAAKHIADTGRKGAFSVP